jgi:nitroreductase
MTDDSAGIGVDTEILRLLRTRVSVRRFRDEPVTDTLLEAVLEAAFRAPTSSNIQAYSVIVVRAAETKARLARAAGDQPWIRQTPVFLAFIADLTRIERALTDRGHDLDDNNLETCLVAAIDTALVGMTAALAARSVGLEGVMIGGVRNDAVGVAEVLKLPPRAFCVFGMCLGSPAEAPPQKPRLPARALIHDEHYGRPRDPRPLEEVLASYDAALAAHYRSTGRATTDDSWTHDMDHKFHPPLRARLREALGTLGLDWR